MKRRNAHRGFAFGALALLLPVPLMGASTSPVTGYTEIFIDTFAPIAYHSTVGPPVAEKPCSTGDSNWCLRLTGGWLKYPVPLGGPDGKGFDHVTFETHVTANRDGCGVTLTRGGAHAHDNVVLIDEDQCNTKKRAAGDWLPSHAAGQHYLWIYCTASPCTLRVFHNIWPDPTAVRVSYAPFTVTVSAPVRRPFSVAEPTPGACATFEIRGSAHHRDVDVTLDWGLGDGAADKFRVHLKQRDVTTYEWKETRCKTLPPSLIDYNLCIRAVERDGLRRDVTDCTTADGGIL